MTDRLHHLSHFLLIIFQFPALATATARTVMFYRCFFIIFLSTLSSASVYRLFETFPHAVALAATETLLCRDFVEVFPK